MKWYWIILAVYEVKLIGAFSLAKFTTESTFINNNITNCLWDINRTISRKILAGYITEWRNGTNFSADEIGEQIWRREWREYV